MLVKDIQELRPTVFVSVLRLLNRIYDKVLCPSTRDSLSLVVQSDHSWDVKGITIKKTLFNKAMQSKTKEEEEVGVLCDLVL